MFCQKMAIIHPQQSQKYFVFTSKNKLDKAKSTETNKSNECKVEVKH